MAGLSMSPWENTEDDADGSERSCRSVTIRKEFFSRKEDQPTAQTASRSPEEVSGLAVPLHLTLDAVIESTSQSIPY